MLSDTLFRGLVEAQSELVWLARADGRLVYANAACGRHFCRAAEDMTGGYVRDHVAASDWPHVSERLSSIIAGCRRPRRSQGSADRRQQRN